MLALLEELERAFDRTWRFGQVGASAIERTGTVACPAKRTVRGVALEAPRTHGTSGSGASVGEFSATGLRAGDCSEIRGGNAGGVMLAQLSQLSAFEPVKCFGISRG